MRGWWTKVIEDLKDLKNLDTYGAIVVAIFAVVLGFVDGWFGKGTKLQAFEFAATLGLLGVIANSALEIRRNMPSPDGLVGPIWRFFSGRKGLPNLDDRISDLHKSVFIFGIQLNAVVHLHREILKEKAIAGIKVQLAMLSPVDAAGNAVDWIDAFGPVHAINDLSTLLSTNLRTLRTWHAELPQGARRNIEIRCYHEIPTASVIIYDVDTKHGFIHVEPILTHLGPAQRPSFWIRDKDDHSLYSAIADRYATVWKAAVPIEQVVV